MKSVCLYYKNHALVFLRINLDDWDLENLGTPIDGTSYFYITPKCYCDTLMQDPRFANKAEFFKQAYKDAVLLADQSQDWPLYGTHASDMYFGRHTQDSNYAAGIAASH